MFRRRYIDHGSRRGVVHHQHRRPGGDLAQVECQMMNGCAIATGFVGQHLRERIIDRVTSRDRRRGLEPGLVQHAPGSHCAPADAASRRDRSVVSGRRWPRCARDYLRPRAPSPRVEVPRPPVVRVAAGVERLDGRLATSPGAATADHASPRTHCQVRSLTIHSSSIRVSNVTHPRSQRVGRRCRHPPRGCRAVVADREREDVRPACRCGARSTKS